MHIQLTQYVYIYTCICKYVYVCVCMYVNMCVCMYACIYIWLNMTYNLHAHGIHVRCGRAAVWSRSRKAKSRCASWSVHGMITFGSQREGCNIGPVVCCGGGGTLGWVGRCGGRGWGYIVLQICMYILYMQCTVVVHLSIYLSIYLSIFLSRCLSMCISVKTYIHKYIYIYTRTSVCLYMYMYTWLYMCIQLTYSTRDPRSCYLIDTIYVVRRSG